jgi:hypothetical protein
VHPTPPPSALVAPAGAPLPVGGPAERPRQRIGTNGGECGQEGGEHEGGDCGGHRRQTRPRRRSCRAQDRSFTEPTQYLQILVLLISFRTQNSGVGC